MEKQEPLRLVTLLRGHVGRKRANAPGAYEVRRAVCPTLFRRNLAAARAMSFSDSKKLANARPKSGYGKKIDVGKPRPLGELHPRESSSIAAREDSGERLALRQARASTCVTGERRDGRTDGRAGRAPPTLAEVSPVIAVIIQSSSAVGMKLMNASMMWELKGAT